MSEIQKIDNNTYMMETLVILATVNEETKEPQSVAQKGHIIAIMDDSNTAGAVFSLNLVNACGVQMSVPFWPVAEVVKAVVDKLINAEEKAADSGKEKGDGR